MHVRQYRKLIMDTTVKFDVGVGVRGIGKGCRKLGMSDNKTWKKKVSRVFQFNLFVSTGAEGAAIQRESRSQKNPEWVVRLSASQARRGSWWCEYYYVIMQIPLETQVKYPTYSLQARLHYLPLLSGMKIFEIKPFFFFYHYRQKIIRRTMFLLYMIILTPWSHGLNTWLNWDYV